MNSCYFIAYIHLDYQSSIDNKRQNKEKIILSINAKSNKILVDMILMKKRKLYTKKKVRREIIVSKTQSDYYTTIKSFKTYCIL